MSDTPIVYIFSDASIEAFGAVDYLQLFGFHGSELSVSFLLGNGKLAPSGGNTIPIMKLGTAVLSAELLIT